MKVVKNICLIIVGLMFMGNEGCKEARERGRTLKRNVRLSGIRAQKIDLGQFGKFDLEGVLNAQLVQSVQDSGYFALTNNLSPQAFSDEIRAQAIKFGVTPRPLAINPDAGRCLRFAPDAIIAGNAVDFELESQTGIKVGTSVSGIGLGVDFGLKTMSMEMAFDAFMPFTGRPLASAFAREKKRNFNIGFNIGLGQLALSPSYYRSTPVAKVTREALENSLINLGEQIGNMVPWTAKVVSNADTHVVLNAGALHGLRKGDMFWVSNVNYQWEGSPCESNLLVDAPTSSAENPLALIQIETEPGLITTLARVVSDGPLREDIREGAKVYVYALVPEEGKDPRPDLPNPADKIGQQ